MSRLRWFDQYQNLIFLHFLILLTVLRHLHSLSFSMSTVGLLGALFFPVQASFISLLPKFFFILSFQILLVQTLSWLLQPLWPPLLPSELWWRLLRLLRLPVPLTLCGLPRPPIGVFCSLPVRPLLLILLALCDLLLIEFLIPLVNLLLL